MIDFLTKREEGLSWQSNGYDFTFPGFSGGSVVKNPPANTGDRKIPDPGKSQVPQSRLSPRTTTTEAHTP